MKLVITEKNDAAGNISRILADGKPKSDKVYQTPVFRFNHEGEEWVCIGLRGHIMDVDFPDRLVYKPRKGWSGVTRDDETIPASIPAKLAHPPFKSKRKPFLADGVDLKGWKVPALPYLVYAPVYKAPAEKEIIRSLKNLAKKADSAIIATDFDREGELIGYDAMVQVLSVNPDLPISRARYSSFTKAEITEAFDNLVDLDTNLAAAGDSRRYIDLIWGATLTRYLTAAKYSGLGNTRSAGRVQTPTLALVVKREEEREAFIPEDYWEIKGTFARDGGEFSALHAAGRFKEEAAAQAVMKAVAGASQGTVTDITKRSRTQAPPAPFNTTSLIAAAASEGISPRNTMRIAESLYMRGLTSYPRVDNTVYPSTMDLSAVVRMLGDVPAYRPYTEKLLSQGKLTATRGKKEETDHPPIYPTAAADASTLDGQDLKLYNLIARRFLATLSQPAVIEGTKITIEVAGEPFAAKGDVLVKKGFREIYPYGLKKDEQLPKLASGDVVDFKGAELLAKQTQPPARYSASSLIQEMERQGLGTKSTRHSTIDRLYQVRYITGDAIEPTQLGRAVIDALHEFAPHITSPTMTSELEDDMTLIADGKDTLDEVVNHSRDMLSEVMDELVPRKDELGERISDAVTADARVGACPKCGGDLLVKTSAKNHSVFLGCANWPDCDVTYPLPRANKIEPVEEPCPICGKPQVKITLFRQKPFNHCVDPECSSNKEPDVDLGACPVCAAAGREGHLIAQKSPRSLKRFVRCTNYDQCGVSAPLPGRGALSATDKVCGHCGYPLAVVATRRGPWELCTNVDCPGKKEAEEKSKKTAAASASGGARSRSASSSAKAAKAAKATKAAKTTKTKRAASTKRGTGAKGGE